MEFGDLTAAIGPALLIALLRIGDITLNVFTTVFTVTGRRAAASVARGLESAVWLAAAGIVFSDINLVRGIGYVTGVAIGTVVGMTVVQHMRLGMVTVRVFVDVHGDQALRRGRVPAALHAADYRATSFDGRGFHGDVEMTLSTVRRRQAEHVMSLAREAVPDAFVAVDNELYPAGNPSRAGRV